MSPAAAAAAPPARRRILVRGIVQGVGFRPFVYSLAVGHGIGGFVANTSAGVVIEAEGAVAELDDFTLALRRDAPPLARVMEVEASNLAPRGDRKFVIQSSDQEGEVRALIPPDVATCTACRRELFDPNDRRHGYPFINCTHCGPRYTIIGSLPYDRRATTMAGFRMCSACRREYENPADRRFHAQPNACAECGPALEMADGTGTVAVGTAALEAARARLLRGEIVALKGLGGFHLACDAANASAVARLRAAKRGSDKPFALMVPHLAAADEMCRLGPEDRAALEGSRRPIVLAPRRAEAGGRIAAAVVPAGGCLGLMLPYSPLHELLLADMGPLVMTSGNYAEEPIAAENAAALRLLAPAASRPALADAVLLHNRPIHRRADDSVARCFAGGLRLLRRSRGFAPEPVELPFVAPPLLACGGELKNTLCLTRDRSALLSPHIGDLETREAQSFFLETADHLRRLFAVDPQWVAHDLHPDAFGRRVAAGLAPPERRIAVQHHHAHIAACMAENQLSGRVLGIALDGTGYGLDGEIWGGEVLIAGYTSFRRAAHLRYVPLPGGDGAARQPWRMALAYLADAFPSGPPRWLPLFSQVPPRQVALIEAVIARASDSAHGRPAWLPRTSSCGRLFDALAALLGIRFDSTFEGQAAMELEAAAVRAASSCALAEIPPLPFTLATETSPWTLDFRPMTRALVSELRGGAAPGLLAARFHATLARALAAICLQVCKQHPEASDLRRVALSGGCFQNWLLLELVHAALLQTGAQVFLHSLVPPNDGGLALGQAAVAAALTTESLTN